MKHYNSTDIYLFTTYILHSLQDNAEYNNKTLIVDFLPKSSLGSHTVHALSLRLRTRLVAALHLRWKSLKTTSEKNTCSNTADLWLKIYLKMDSSLCISQSFWTKCRGMPTTGCFCRRGMVGTRNWHGNWDKIQSHFDRYLSYDQFDDGRIISWNVALISHTCSWRDKLIVLWTLSRQEKLFFRRQDTAFFWFWVQPK